MFDILQFHYGTVPQYLPLRRGNVGKGNPIHPQIRKSNGGWSTAQRWALVVWKQTRVHVKGGPADTNDENLLSAIVVQTAIHSRKQGMWREYLIEESWSMIVVLRWNCAGYRMITSHHALALCRRLSTQRTHCTRWMGKEENSDDLRATIRTVTSVDKTALAFAMVPTVSDWCLPWESISWIQHNLSSCPAYGHGHVMKHGDAFSSVLVVSAGQR